MKMGDEARERHVENITQQLQEIEILEAMFAGDNEMVWPDPSLLIDAQEFRDSNGKSPTNIQCLVFDMNLKISLENTPSNDFSVKMTIKLPSMYPEVRPELSIIPESMTKNNVIALKAEMNEFICSLGYNELIILDIIYWLKENVGLHHKEDINEPSKSNVESGRSDEMTCMWLYMHHIYSKHKRKDIQSWSHDYALTGFCLPGKPGVVYIEGLTGNVETYFDRLRALPWQRITCRHKEICAKRVFTNFQELSFDPHGYRSNHMDFGMFFRFLTEHDLGHMFKELFGVEGQVKE